MVSKTCRYVASRWHGPAALSKLAEELKLAMIECDVEGTALWLQACVSSRTIEIEILI